MTDLFGNEEPANNAKSTVRKNLSLENQDLIPMQTAQSMDYDFTKIRKAFHNGQWYFAYMDVISVLADTSNPRRYAHDLKAKLQNEGSEVYDHIVQLKFIAPDGKLRSTQCLSREDTFRLIEEIPSPKAEPFKQWIAHLAHERLEEIEDPARCVENAIEAYRRQGKSDPWIEARIKGIAIRKGETAVLQSHGITKPVDFAHFTDRTNVAVYGHKAQTEKALRGIDKSHSLRDCSTETELGLLFLHESACRDGIEETRSYGRTQIDKVYDVVGGIIANTKQALESAFKPSRAAGTD